MSGPRLNSFRHTIVTQNVLNFMVHEGLSLPTIPDHTMNVLRTYVIRHETNNETLLCPTGTFQQRIIRIYNAVSDSIIPVL